MPLTAAQKRERDRAAAAARAAAKQSSLTAALEAAVAAGARKDAAAGARHLATTLTLPDGRKVKLADSRGAATPLGLRYEELTRDLDNWDRARGLEPETSRGRYAIHRTLGRVMVQRKVRRAPGGGTDLVPTELGKSFFRNHSFEYQVLIPVARHFPRRDHTWETYEGPGEQEYVAVTDAQLEASAGAEHLKTVGLVKPSEGLAGEAEREAHIRAAVEAWIATLPLFDPHDPTEDPARPHRGVSSVGRPLRRASLPTYRLLWPVYEVAYTYDPSRPLRLSAIVSGRYDLRPSGADVILDRPLRGVPIAPDDFYERFGVTPLAWESQPTDGPGCIPVQFAVCFRGRTRHSHDGPWVYEPLFDLEYIEAAFDAIFHDLGYQIGQEPYDGLTAAEARGVARPWRPLGVTSRIYEEFCRRHDASLWLMHSAHCVYKYDPPNAAERHRPIVAANIWGGHGFIYEPGSAAIRGIAQMRPRPVDPPLRKCLVGLLGEDADDGPPARRSRERYREAWGAPLACSVEQPADSGSDDDEPLEPPGKARFFSEEALESLPPGRQLLFCEDVEAARRTLREKGLPFRTLLGSQPTRVRGLVILRKGGRRDGVLVKLVPSDHASLDRFCRRLSDLTGLVVTYGGEQAASTARRVIQALLATRRAHVAPARRRALLAAGRGLCAGCGDPLGEGEAEVDHVRPLQFGGSNADANLQVLCAACHREKTTEERQPLDRQVRMESQLSLELLRVFHHAPKPRQVVFGSGPPRCPQDCRCARCAYDREWPRPAPPPARTQLHEGYCECDACAEARGADEQYWRKEEDWRRRPEPPRRAPEQRVHCLDAVGCRRNALLRCGRPLPVFCVLDEVRALAPGEDLLSYDFLLVDCAEPRPLANGRVLPYSGARWYWVELAGFLLARGIVSRRHVTHGLRASGHLEPSALAAAYGATLAAWRAELEPEARSRFWEEEQAGRRERWLDGEADLRAKRLWNSALGLFNRLSSSVWSATHSTEQADAPGGAADLKRTLVAPDGEVSYEFLLETELVGNRSWRPLGQIALDVEQLRVAQALELVETSPHVTGLRAVNVDGVHFTGDAGAVEAEAARRLVFADGAPAFRMKRPRSGWEEAREEGLLPQCPPAPWPEALSLRELHWGWRRHEVEDEVALTSMRGADAAWRGRMVEAVLENGGAYVRGVAGVGKSHFLKGLVARLREAAGEANVAVAAYQHSSAQLVNGVTLLHLLHAVGRKQDRWLVLDEVSQVPVACLGDVAALRLVGWKVVIAGDWEGQLPPVVDRWGEALAGRDMAGARLVQELANGLRVDLTFNHRCRAHPEHFAWYTGLYGRRAQLRELAADAARRFAPGPGFFPDHALCASHRDRLALNALINERQAAGREAERALLLAADAGGADRHMTMAAQDAWVWPGLVLIGCGSHGGSRGRILNAVVYRVVRLTAELAGGVRRLRGLVVVVDEEMRREGSDAEELELPLERVAVQLRLAHAMTYHAAQGRTLRDRRVLLLGTRSRVFTLAHLIVGGSRVTNGEHLAVPDAAAEGRWLNAAEAALGRMRGLAGRA